MKILGSRGILYLGTNKNLVEITFALKIISIKNSN